MSEHGTPRSTSGKKESEPARNTSGNKAGESAQATFGSTARSDRRLEAWNTREPSLSRATLALERTFDAPPDAIFPLLCPTREYDWIPQWECELLHSRSGLAEHNAVFRTCIQGEEEIWVCTRYEPDRGIHYLRMATTHVAKLEITLVEVGEGMTRVHWSLTESALTREGNQHVDELRAPDGRIRVLEHLFDDLAHYLETAEMREL